VKIILSIICLTLFGFTMAARAGDDSKFPIYRHVNFFGNTNTWFVPTSDFDKLPKWDEKGEPPLSVGKAVSLAKAEMVSIGGSTNAYVMSVEFHPAGPASTVPKYSKFHSFWFYVIHFEEVWTVGSSATCVVLMDGSVLWPQLRHEPKQKSINDYLD
jgi:hypothetical protein